MRATHWSQLPYVDTQPVPRGKKNKAERKRVKTDGTDRERPISNGAIGADDRGDKWRRN